MLNKQYLAGLFDGEGWISLRPQSTKRYLSSITIQVGICNTHPIVKKLYDNFGGFLTSRKENLQHKKCYRWSLGKKKDIKNFLELIYPYLIIKKEQAKIMLKFIGLKTVSGRRRNPYLIKRALKYINKIRILNGRVKRKDVNVNYGIKGDVEWTE